VPRRWPGCLPMPSGRFLGMLSEAIYWLPRGFALQPHRFRGACEPRLYCPRHHLQNASRRCSLCQPSNGEFFQRKSHFMMRGGIEEGGSRISSRRNGSQQGILPKPPEHGKPRKSLSTTTGSTSSTPTHWLKKNVLNPQRLSGFGYRGKSHHCAMSPSHEPISLPGSPHPTKTTGHCLSILK
jgi:hypothetical protein